MDRRFTEEEMRAVFARAAERQKRAEAIDVGSGLSLAEMQEVAAAAGIDPTHVAAAVAEIAAAPEPRKTFAGAPVEITRVRRLPVQVSDDAWARVVSELRRAFNEDGIAGQLGRIREWNAMGRGPRRDMSTRLAIEPDGDGARVTIRQTARDFAFGFTLAGSIMTFMSLLFTTLATAGVDDELWIPAGLMGAMALTFLFGLQIGMRMWANRQERKFEALLDRVELIAREDAGLPPQARRRQQEPPLSAQESLPARERPGGVPSGRLGLDALDDDSQESSAGTPGRRTRT
jgi:hypothetical protein